MAAHRVQPGRCSQKLEFEGPSITRQSRRLAGSHGLPGRSQYLEDDVTGQPYLMKEDARGVATEVADGDIPPAALDLLHSLRQGDGSPVKYERWATPGGENYRELLMTLPPHRPAPQTAAHAEFERAMIGEVPQPLFSDELKSRRNTPNTSHSMSPTQRPHHEPPISALAENRFQSQHYGRNPTSWRTSASMTAPGRRGNESSTSMRSSPTGTKQGGGRGTPPRRFRRKRQSGHSRSGSDEHIAWK